MRIRRDGTVTGQGISSNKTARVKPAARAVLPMAVAMAFGVGAPGAVAQEQSVGALEEIMVTARRRAENLQEVPVAITALSSEYLRDNNITELAQLRTHVPSLGVSSAGGSTNNPLISLRGQRPNDLLIAADAAVPIYFADVVMSPTHGTNLAMYDLENVQILKGPQGTLFGRNSTGGALLFSPTKPGEELGGYFEAKVGDYGLFGAEGAVDIPLGDSAQLRIAGRSLKRDGYQDNLADNALGGDEEFWDEDSQGVRVSLNVQFSENFENLLVVGYDENDMKARVPTPHLFTAEPGGILSVVNIVHNGGLGFIGSPELSASIDRQSNRDWNEIETDLNATEKVENLVISNTTTWQINDNLTLKNIFGYRDLETSSASDVDGTAVPVYGARTSSSEPVTVDPALSMVEAEQFSNEIQLLGTSNDGKLEWIVGGYWLELDGSQESPVQIIGANPNWPPIPPIAPSLGFVWTVANVGFPTNSPRGDATNESTSIFAEATYDLNEQWAVTVGARQTWDDREVTVRNTRFFQCLVSDSSGVPLPASDCARTESEDFSATTWRAIAEFTPRDGMLMYGSVSTGYRAGGFNLRGVNNFDLTPFDEEKVTTFEFGHKTDWNLGEVAAMRTNLAVYLQKFDDIQKTQDTFSGGVFGTSIVNAAEAEIKGIEFDVWMAPSEHVEFSLAWSYVDAGYDDWQIPLEGGGFIDASDREFSWIPENSLNASVKFTLPLDASLGEVSFMASLYWQDDVTADDSQEELVASGILSDPVAAQVLELAEVDSYSVVNLRLDWANVLGSELDFALYLNNAGDEDYATGGLHVVETLGYVARVYGAPRTFGASLRWQF